MFFFSDGRDCHGGGQVYVGELYDGGDRGTHRTVNRFVSERMLTCRCSNTKKLVVANVDNVKTYYLWFPSNSPVIMLLCYRVI